MTFQKKKKKKKLSNAIFTKVIPCFLTVFGKKTKLIAKKHLPILKKRKIWQYCNISLGMA
jgi:hypothetical protein